MSKWSDAYKRSLPDKCFAFVDGDTRKLPIFDARGLLDEGHLRSAIGRLWQTHLPSEAIRIEIQGKLNDLWQRSGGRTPVTNRNWVPVTPRRRLVANPAEVIQLFGDDAVWKKVPGKSVWNSTYTSRFRPRGVYFEVARDGDVWCWLWDSHSGSIKRGTAATKQEAMKRAVSDYKVRLGVERLKLEKIIWDLENIYGEQP